jgi:hypothetical protein
VSSSSTCSYEMRASAAVNVDVGEDITYAQPCNEIWYEYECTSDGIQMEKDGLWVNFYCNNDMNARHAMPAAHARNENRCIRHGWVSYSTVRVKKMVRTRTSIFMNSVCINVGTFVYEYVYV